MEIRRSARVRLVFAWCVLALAVCVIWLRVPETHVIAMRRTSESAQVLAAGCRDYASHMLQSNLSARRIRAELGGRGGVMEFAPWEDYWGVKFRICYSGTLFQIVSAGADQEFGTFDDYFGSFTDIAGIERGSADSVIQRR